MSAAPEHAHGSTAPGMPGRAWGPLRREWTKLLFQRRSYLIWAGAFAIPFLIALDGFIHLFQGAFLGFGKECARLDAFGGRGGPSLPDESGEFHVDRALELD